MRVDRERWPSNGIRRPGLRAFVVGHAGRGAHFFSVRQINAIFGFSDRWDNAKHENL